MAKRKKIFAAVIALAIAFALLFSALFIVTQADHSCTESCCRICQQINTCLEQMSNITAASSSVPLAAILAFALVLVFGSDKNVFGTNTLIKLKVKLSN
ncbi:MAG: hypothetical protein J1E81_07650 [Eubacterium sp.]|nr:hypothetical protein [Eubacterium sp.]